MTELEWMVLIREKTELSVVLEASLHPIEWLCTTGRHHRGQWFLEKQTKGETAMIALEEMLKIYKITL